MANNRTKLVFAAAFIIGAVLGPAAGSAVRKMHQKLRAAAARQSCTLSNRMHVYGCMYEGPMGKNGKILSVDTGSSRMTVYDEGNGQPYVIQGGNKRTDLTYGYGSKRFPIWEPYAFRESSEYREMQRILSDQLRYE